jgi:predicted Co/Zn/Cd cation transporter (cation efflux family)
MNYHEMSASQNINYRKSGFLLAGVAAIIYTIGFIQGKQQPYLSVIVALLALLAFYEAWPLRKTIDLFIGFGNFMQRYTNPLVFGLIYIVAVIPTSLVLKLAGKDILQLRFEGNMSTYWKDHSNGKSWKESFHKQY